MTENPTLKTLELTFSNGDTIRVEANLPSQEGTYFMGAMSIGVGGDVSGGGMIENKKEFTEEQAIRKWLGKAISDKYLEHSGKIYVTAHIVSAKVAPQGGIMTL